MCLIGLAVDVPGPWLLVLAANRDEFHDRHAAPATYWASEVGARPGVLAGRDLQGGGTWLGLRQSGDGLRVAALTNLRPGLMPTPPAISTLGTHSSLAGRQGGSMPAVVPPSRGQLVAGFLGAETSPPEFLRDLQPAPSAYAGFNLLALMLRGGATARPAVDAWYLNNLPDGDGRALGSGIHLLSNATIDVAWPKTARLRRALSSALGERLDAAGLCGRLFDALADRTPAGIDELPRTGLDLAREHLLSAPFIVDDHYGTRCSSVLVVARSGETVFCERSFGPGGRALGTVQEQIRLSA